MKIYLPIEFMVVAFSLCTLAFHSALYLRISASTTRILWMGIIVATTLGYVLRLMIRQRRQNSGNRFYLWIWGIAIVWACPMFMVLRPNNDDLSLLHRVVWQIQHMQEPFVCRDTTHGISDLPPISYLHLTTSYEPLVGLMADWFGLDPIWAYQNAGSLFGSIALVLVYALLYRRFRLTPCQSVAAVLTALSFLLLDGGSGRTFGRLAFMMWTAKVLLWLVGIPLTLDVALRFLVRPTCWRFLVLFLMGVASVGLSNSGIFLFPSALFCLALAYIANGGFRWKRVRRAIMLNLASLYCMAFAAGIELKIIPEPLDREAWAIGWPTTWHSCLGLVIPNVQILVRDVIIIFLIVPLSLQRSLRFIAPIYCLACIVLFFNPWAGPEWLKLLQAGNYWRLLYLNPIPLWAGCVAACFRRPSLARMVSGLPRTISVLFVMAGIMLILYSWSNHFHANNWRRPWDYSFDRATQEFAEQAMPHLKGRLLLAPEDAAVVIGLQKPDLRLYATRWLDTRHFFANAGRKQEGVERSLAQSFINGNASCEAAESFERSLSNQVDAIVTRVDMLPQVRFYLEKQDAARWKIAVELNSYVLLLR